MKFNTTVYTIILVVLSLSTWAQNKDLELDPNNDQDLEAVIRQDIQKFSPLNAPTEGVIITQNGNFNHSRVTTQTSGVLVNIAQNGNLNSIELGLIGQNSDILLTQTGNNNLMNLPNVSAHNVSFTAIQHNNSNVLDIKGDQTISLPNLKIEQSGGATLMITSPSDFVGIGINP